MNVDGGHVEWSEREEPHVAVQSDGMRNEKRGELSKQPRKEFPLTVHWKRSEAKTRRKNQMCKNSKYTHWHLHLMFIRMLNDSHGFYFLFHYTSTKYTHLNTIDTGCTPLQTIPYALSLINLHTFRVLVFPIYLLLYCGNTQLEWVVYCNCDTHTPFGILSLHRRRTHHHKTRFLTKFKCIDKACDCRNGLVSFLWHSDVASDCDEEIERASERRNMKIHR